MDFASGFKFLMRLRYNDSYIIPNTLIIFCFVDLLQILENYIVATEKVTCNTFFDLLYKIQDEAKIVLIGCETHRETLTAQIIQFYMCTRLQFMCTFINKRRIENVESKNLSKLSKLK